MSKKTQEIQEETIDGKIQKKQDDFIDANKEPLAKAQKLILENYNHIEFIYEKPGELYKYLKHVKILVITANETERKSLFSFFVKDSKHHITRIVRDEMVYSFFEINSFPVVHVEPENTGSDTHGGTSHLLKKALKCVRPTIVLSLGVAFGCDYDKNDYCDVLVGRQFFSYDKAVKMSSDALQIKKLHMQETDECLLSRLKSVVNTETKTEGLFDNKFQVLVGNMVTGEFVVDSADFRELVFSPFKPFGIVGGDMEAFGMFEEIRNHKYSCGKIYGMMIKGICDWGAGKSGKSKIDKKKPTETTISNPELDNDTTSCDDEYDDKNRFQILAMLNVCQVCSQFLVAPNFFADFKIKTIRRYFVRFLYFVERKWRKILLILILGSIIFLYLKFGIF